MSSITPPLAIFVIKNRYYGNVIDVAGLPDAFTVIGFAENGGDNQKWRQVNGSSPERVRFQNVMYPDYFLAHHAPDPRAVVVSNNSTYNEWEVINVENTENIVSIRDSGNKRYISTSESQGDKVTLVDFGGSSWKDMWIIEKKN